VTQYDEGTQRLTPIAGHWNAGYELMDFHLVGKSGNWKLGTADLRSRVNVRLRRDTSK
jgi:hypothetical protein